VIEIRNLTKSYGDTVAVDSASFTAPTGAVTGFLGPNGAGKTTALRVLLGLARPDSGEAFVDGKPYVNLTRPRLRVGAVLDQSGFHPGRSAQNHLRVIARSAGIGSARVGEVLEFVGLAATGRRRVGGYSQGMRQRLALAGALLCDPPVLVLDEPSTGLDPAGIVWLRIQMRQWASEGRTVLFSSHVLAEVEAAADRVVIIDRGRIIREGTTAEVVGGPPGVVVRTTDGARLAMIAEQRGWTVRDDGGGRLVVFGAEQESIGRAAASEGIVLSELARESTGRQLEEVFLALTGGEVRP
jgi:ABC-2 type transport system ATP-binding protein